MASWCVHLPCGVPVVSCSHDGRQRVEDHVRDVDIFWHESSLVVGLEVLVPELPGVHRDASQQHPDRWCSVSRDDLSAVGESVAIVLVLGEHGIVERVVARTLEVPGEVHHGRHCSPCFGCRVSPCSKCRLESVANDSAKKIVSRCSVVVLGGNTGPLGGAVQQLLRARVAVLDAYLVAWWKMVNCLRDHHLVGHALLRPLEVRSRHGGLSTERADEVRDAVEDVGVPREPHVGSWILSVEVLPDVGRRPPGVHACHRLSLFLIFLLTMIGGDWVSTMIDGGRGS